MTKSAFLAGAASALLLSASGVIASPSTTYFDFAIEPNQVVPPVLEYLGSGWASLALTCEEDSLVGTLWLSVRETPTAVHLHGPAQSGENAPMLFALPVPPFQNYVMDVRIGGVRQYCELLSSEQWYIDEHTLDHPGGAMRGQAHTKVLIESVGWGAIKSLYQ